MMKRKSINTLYNILKGCFWSIPITITFSDLIGSVAKVEGTSMIPTVNPEIKNGESTDWVWLNRISLYFTKLKRGEVVVLTCPYNKRKKLIKRVVALEGDHIWSRDENRLNYIPLGHCWVEGDEGGNSIDSNQFGPIPQALIEGRVQYILWPWKRWGSIPPVRLPSSSNRLFPSKVT